MKLHKLSSKERKELSKAIDSQWGMDFPDKDYYFFRNSKGRIYILRKTEQEVALQQLRIMVMGMYFGQWQADGLRLSLDGADLVAPHATKNVIDISEKYANTWIHGDNIPCPDEQYDRQLVLVRHRGHGFGCGKVMDKEIHPYIAKSRRILDVAN